jgi:hypothetical protein
VLKRLFIAIFLWRWGGAFGRLHFVAAKAMIHGLGFEVPLLWSTMCQGESLGATFRSSHGNDPFFLIIFYWNCHTIGCLWV